MFSVIIPIHNKLPHLDRTIESVMQQTFQEFELILVDDASKDGSEKKMHEYKDSRIKTFKRDVPGPGGYAARNLGIKNAKYKWIAFLDADDEWHKDYLKEVKNCIQKNSNIQMVTTKWISTTEEITDEINIINEPIDYSEFQLIDYLKEPKYVWTGAVVIHKDIVSKVGGFPTDKLCKRGGDVDTWIRWLAVSKKNVLIKKTLAYYHQGTVNQVTGRPNTHFCAYETLKNIYRENHNDKALLRSIRQFSNRFMYNMMVRHVKSGMSINFNDLKKIHLDTHSLPRIMKLFYLRLKFKLIGKS